MSAAPGGGNRPPGGRGDAASLLGRVLRVLALVVVALVLGIGSAVWTTRSRFASGGLENGPWGTNENIGSSAADAYLRAGVALGGLLALNKTETVYFTAVRDEAGEPLRSSCVYRVSGRDPESRWWSITAYGEDHFLIPGSESFSVDKTAVERGEDGSFAIVVGGPKQASNWIGTGAAADAAPFSLTLRLYNPEPGVVANLTGVALPRIVKERCA